jgi:hypothetical protein
MFPRLPQFLNSNCNNCNNLRLSPSLTPNHVNGIGKRTSLASTLSSTHTGESGTSGRGESKMVLTVATSVPPPSMSVGMSTGPIAGTTTTHMIKPSSFNSISTSLKSSADSTRTSSKGSSLRMTGPGGGSKARPTGRYEPVSMYAVPSALLSKPMNAGGKVRARTSSRLSSLSGQ